MPVANLQPKRSTADVLFCRSIVGRAGGEAATYSVTADELVDEALEAAGVPPRFRRATFDTFVPRPGTVIALATCREISTRNTASAVLSGPTGTGKTRLAAGVLEQRARVRVQHAKQLASEVHGYGTPAYMTALEEDLTWRRPFRSRFRSVPRLLEAMRRQIRLAADDDPLDELLRAPFLVLDDLGAEKVTDWTIDRLYLLIGSRYDDGLGTVVTSNYSLDELADRGYDRMVSRLCEDGPLLRIDATDYRPEVAA